MAFGVGECAASNAEAFLYLAVGLIVLAVLFAGLMLRSRTLTGIGSFMMMILGFSLLGCEVLIGAFVSLLGLMFLSFATFG